MWCAISIRWFLPLLILIIIHSSESGNRNGNVTCPSYTFSCTNRKCVVKSFQCFGDDDCGDNTDEDDCVTCRRHSFACGNGRCIRRSLLCDGGDTCGDYTDEDNCVGHGALLFSTFQEIWKVDFDTSEYTLVASGLSSAVAVDYDYEENTVIWGDYMEQTIYSAKIGEEGSNAIVKDKMLITDEIAVDWIHNNLYWTDSGLNTISVASMDGKLIKSLFRTNLDEPRDIAVNPLEGWMFWTDTGKSAKIERAGMDGTHRSIIVSKNILWPNGLEIDLVSKRLFWVEAKLHKLCSSDYDGTNVNEVYLSATELKHPWALDMFEDWLYWTDMDTNRIYKADKFYGRNVQTIVSDVFSPFSMRVYHSYKQPKGTNNCGPLNGNCSHLCLPAPHVTSGSAKFTCACPDGMVLTDNQQNCLTIEMTSTAKSTEVMSTISVLQASSQSVPSYILNETLPEIKEEFDDSERIAAIIIGVLGGLAIVLSVVGFCFYKQYLRRKIDSKNSVNTVYRETAEDQCNIREDSISTSKVIRS